MPLAPGFRLGPYEVVSLLGAGGMGEVYTARDVRLGRTVAVKILPPELAADPQFRERFDREAKSISSLAHPHICALYDVGEVTIPNPAGAGANAPLRYLVLEHLEGETLATRLGRGALPLPDALRLGLDVLSALDAAHRRGIVHRDLKPGNIMLTKSGAKLLDFGLAKSGSPLSLVPGGSALPTTIEAPLTARGTLVGTFQYMAPEQIEGDAADARTDLFAFGAVLYEMVTGRGAFTGKSQPSLLGAILKDDPPPVSQTQAVAPPALDHLVRTCLAKDPDARYQTAHDVWLQLKWIADGGSAAGLPAPVRASRRQRERLAWALTALMAVLAFAAGAFAFMQMRGAAPPAHPVEFAIAAEDGSLPSGGVAVSPDGRHVVFSTVNGTGVRGLWMRPLASSSARALRGTEGGSGPFWSPDGRYVGFFAGGQLRKIDPAGGTSIALCDSGTPPGGGTWNRDNVIVFSPGPLNALKQVDAGGGSCSPLTSLADGETSHLQPEFLPDGRHVLYFESQTGSRQLMVASLDGGASMSLGRAESAATYAAGHLLFVRAGTLVAQPFDAATRQLTGEPAILAPDMNLGPAGRLPVNAVGSVLAFARGTAPSVSKLTWFDRTGQPLGVVGEPAAYMNINLSPDERRLAVSMIAGSPANRDIWIIDLARADTASRRTFHQAVDADPAWSPDGTRIVFNSNRDRASYNAGFMLHADGSGGETPLLKMERLVDSPEWSHDGRSIVFTGGNNTTSNDLWIQGTSGDSAPHVLLATPFAEDSPAFSPDDRWIAYNANPSDRLEVYVRSAAPGGGQLQISRDGGFAPRWRGDGGELFFLGLDGRMMAATITKTPAGLEAGVPRALFATPLRRGTERRPFAVSKDGTRFLLAIPEPARASPVTVILNWTSTLPQ